MPTLILMENAAIHASRIILNLHRRTRRASVAILCGSGNNAGDGYAIARHLHNDGLAVHLYAARDPGDLTGDAAINADICRRMNLPLDPIQDTGAIEAAAAQWAHTDFLIDALLGTGFHGQVREPAASIITAVNAVSARPDGPRVIAVDVPSGLDCQTGQPANAVVRADTTITFVARKIGFDAPEAAALLGEVIVAPIGVPPELIDEVAYGDGPVR